ncbi:hypothetical protein H5410_003497 [Solanum commersonii]|uniref:Uncharacterized protein n=1 Tax=Solanum commersonii TaxID=4109 RepID=A0A9J6B5B1_SOLCO|nr:hypothetical protein H5410_003497 [Solanum commersonii]
MTFMRSHNPLEKSQFTEKVTNLWKSDNSSKNHNPLKKVTTYRKKSPSLSLTHLPSLVFSTPHRSRMHSYRLKTQNNSLLFKQIMQTRPTLSRPPIVRYNSSTINYPLEHKNNWVCL